MMVELGVDVEAGAVDGDDDVVGGGEFVGDDGGEVALGVDEYPTDRCGPPLSERSQCRSGQCRRCRGNRWCRGKTKCRAHTV